MADFYQIALREGKKKQEVFADFVVGRSKDLMVRGRAFYAIWDEEAGLWSTDEYDVQRIVDKELREYAEGDPSLKVKYLRSYGDQGWAQFRKYLQNISDNHHVLDQSLTFANTPVRKKDYVSKRLPYELAPGDFSAWNELVGTLYSVEERAKIEWAIGAVISGDSKAIQKFLVFYGPAGTGKSTILNIVQKLFDGYTTTFEAKALASNSNGFSTEVFKNNPLVAIQHDGDLSRIEDNTKLNSIVSHEEMVMNEKFKASYSARVNAILFMGTNQPVRISDAKSGIIRRLIDIHPTGVKIPVNRYSALMGQIDFELGAIAHHCLEVYRKMGKNYYNTYRPLEMMLQTDTFFNFVEANYDVFKSQDGVSLKQAYALYKEFCDDTGIERKLPQYKVREELRNYFDEFHDRSVLDDGTIVRSYYKGFTADKFKTPTNIKEQAYSLVMDETESIFDEVFADQPAQLANAAGIPEKRWSSVETKLSDLDTTQVHFVKVPESLVVIDFDLRDDGGGKSLQRNLEAASSWPPTYAEFSKSGAGVHLHYYYAGDTGELNSVYSEGIEVKVYPGNGSLRRKLSRCNNVPIATLTAGLPLKEKKKMLPTQTIQSEKGLRDLIRRNMRKEIHPGTKPSIDFIKKILDEAYESGMAYDVTDLRGKLIAFANNSTNQPLQSLKVVQTMKFKSETVAEPAVPNEDDRIVIFDLEVYPNLFVVCWKYEDSPTVVRMVNPSAAEIESLFKLKLVGYNARRYDNHILYGRFMGYNNEGLFRLSQAIINGQRGAYFGEAYGLSYADIYDFSSKKQSLKMFEIELGLNHMELDLPWEEPVPEHLWEKVVEYCVNDVVATEAVFKARKQDYVARQILAKLSGLTVNDTTQRHTAKIIFGNDRNPQSQFVYTDLSKEFDGYCYNRGVSTYRGETVGEGGYVYSEPGVYANVALLDVASMHPTSIEQLNLFGPYTRRFSELKEARLAIKHEDYKKARTLLDGRLAEFIGSDPASSRSLSDALKIVINIVYGLTSASFDNPFRDVRNKDNIVAKRGALFMIDLKHALQEMGVQVVHIKTDSVKIPDATPEIIDMVVEFGKKYGYVFEHEATYEKFCLVNDAVYIAREGGKWHAVGAQFQHPYVFKTLFSKEPIGFDDLCETKQVTQGAMYLDFDSVQRPMITDRGRGGMHFVGRTGRFVPVMPESGGAILWRIKDEKQFAVTATKGYFWLEANVAKKLGDVEIDMSYFESLANDAIRTINKFGDYEEFVS
jgi:energy-coupling factor transporter ATP-binding protein EcfA2